jgi:tetratricopeptide (TPR) repeat protein
MKYSLTFIALLICKLCFSQQISYKEWQEEAKNNIRLLPEYGHVQKTNEQLEADQELIKDEVKQYRTHRKASDTLISFGFNNIYAGDIKKAMYRFNQAYLLDPENENVYWGFASVYFSFNDYNEALAQLEKGLSINPNCANILTDKATIYTVFFHTKNNPEYLDKAISIFYKSYKIDPSNQNTLFKLSAAYYYKKDCVNAWKFYNECEKLGGKPITRGYTDALKKMCSK